MSTGNSGAKVRLIVLLLVLVAVALGGWFVVKGGGFGGAGGLEADIINGKFSGGTLEAVTTALGAQPVEQPNTDGEKSTAKIYLYTLSSTNPERKFVRARVSADGKVIYTRYVDADGREVVIGPNR